MARGAGALFFTCSVGHGIVAAHLLLPTWGIEVASGSALRHAFSEWHMFLWPPLTAAAGVFYWMLRTSSSGTMQGAGLFEDLQQRRQRAMEIHDNVVQDIATAKMALERGEVEEAQQDLDRALTHSREIISDLLGPEEEGVVVQAGDLRRETAAPDVN